MKTNLMSLLILSMAFLTGCSGGGSGGDATTGAAIAASSDSNAGIFFNAVKSTTNSSKYALVLKISGTNSFNAVEVYTPTSNSAVSYVRKSKGTFIRSGDTYTVTWSYETCNPMGTQTYTISTNNPADKIFVTSGNTTVMMLNDAAYAAPYDLANFSYTVEDTDCNKFP